MAEILQLEFVHALKLMQSIHSSLSAISWAIKGTQLPEKKTLDVAHELLLFQVIFVFVLFLYKILDSTRLGCTLEWSFRAHPILGSIGFQGKKHTGNATFGTIQTIASFTRQFGTAV